MNPNQPLPFSFAGDDFGRIHRNEPLCNYCTYRIGGPADYMIEPESIHQLARLRSYLQTMNIPAVVIGEGSNLLIPDAGYRGVVIRVSRKMPSIDVCGDCITVDAGMPAPLFASRTAYLGLSGVEHIIGIPGSMGGLVSMNGGSLRQSIGDVIQWVEVVDVSGEIHRLPGDQCGFGYRTSVFQKSSMVVARICMKLTFGDSKRIRSTMREILQTRRRKFPLKQPNCGSVFLSSPELYKTWGPPGKIIEDTGLKGVSSGGATVSRQHGNFIVADQFATANDVLDLIRYIINEVFERTGMKMHSELRYLHPEKGIIPVSDVLEGSC